MPTVKTFPKGGKHHVGSTKRFPYKFTEIGKRLTYGDFIVKTPSGKYGWDTASAALAANHNLNAYLLGFKMVRDELDKDNPVMPAEVSRGYNIEAHTSTIAIAALKQNPPVMEIVSSNNHRRGQL